MNQYPISFTVPTLENGMNTTEHVWEIMRQEEEYIQKNTGGKVRGEFGVIKTGLSPIEKQMKALGFPVAGGTREDESRAMILTSSTLRQTPVRSVTGAERKDVNDVPDMREARDYGFEFYNSTYRFCLFEVKLSPQYPLTLRVDKGVLDDDTRNRLGGKIQGHGFSERRESNQVRVPSDNELVNTMNILCNSNKVQYVLYRLLQMENKRENKETRDSEAAQPDSPGSGQ